MLLRGFDVSSAQAYENVLLELGLDLVPDYVPGDARRHHHSKFIFTAADTPRQHFIAPHNEMAYCIERPAIISFFCKRCSRAQNHPWPEPRPRAVRWPQVGWQPRGRDAHLPN